MSALRTYADCFTRTGHALAKSPWTLLLPVACGVLLVPVSAIAGALGLVGGFLYGIVLDALFSSVLYVVSELVSGSRVRIKELPQSVRHYFWPIMNVLFVLWIAGFVVRPLLSTAGGGWLMLGLWLIIFILLNSVPEVIYRHGVFGGVAAIADSIAFMREQWLTWLPPNLLIAAALWLGLPLARALPFGELLAPVIASAVIFASLVYRGFLFRELDGSTSRQRALRQRLGR